MFQAGGALILGKVLKVLGVIAAIFLTFLGGYFTFMYVTYIDETVVEGSGYGFTIGQSKEEVYEAAARQYADIEVQIMHPLRQGEYGPLIGFSFSEEEYHVLRERARWDIYLSKERLSDLVTLEFKEDKLVSIYRHRKYFELP